MQFIIQDYFQAIIQQVQASIREADFSSSGGFVKGRNIVDNIIQVQEAMHSSYLRKEKGMIIKLDMKNAFDRVKLSFLYDVLLSFGFCPNFVNLIKTCTDQPWIAPLLNGRPTNFFKASRSLR